MAAVDRGNYYPFCVADGRRRAECRWNWGFYVSYSVTRAAVSEIPFEYPWLLQMRLKGVIISICWTFKKEKKRKKRFMASVRCEMCASLNGV